jgi:hypothetical protein
MTLPPKKPESFYVVNRYTYLHALLHLIKLTHGQRRTDSRTPQPKSESKPKLKRDRSSTTTMTKPAKIAKMADGRECIDLDSDSEDSSHKEERTGASKNVKKRAPKIEVVDLLD